MSVFVFILHIIHGLFDHEDPKAADFAFFRRERHIRIGFLQRIKRHSGVGKGYHRPARIIQKRHAHHSRALAGGCTTDITVYAWMLTTFMLGKDYRGIKVSALKGGDEVDVVNQITLEYENTLAALTATLVTDIDEEMVIRGTKGSIRIPRPHFARECFLYDAGGQLLEHYTDEQTVNGFTWEIAETMRCVREGLPESPVVPWADTIDCAGVFDQVRDSIGP